MPSGRTFSEIDTQARELRVIVATENKKARGRASPHSSVERRRERARPPEPVALLPLGYRGRANGVRTLAPIGANRVMIVGGNASPKVPPTFVADLTTGAVTQAKPDLTPPRLGATVTAFGDGALVAGGVSDSSSLPVADAQFYSPALGGFDRTRTIALSEPRANCYPAAVPPPWMVARCSSAAAPTPGAGRS